MKSIKIKHRFSDKVLFAHEQESNTLRATVETAIKQGVSLPYAHLKYADLRGLDLRGAFLRHAFLYGADLQGSNLREVDLRGVSLSHADLRGTDLRYADLRDANLCRADLRGADLWGADLRDVNLYLADLRGANLPKGFYQIVGMGNMQLCITFDSINNRIICGYFYGTLEEFEQAVNEAHGDDVYDKQYQAAIDYFKQLLSIENQEDTKAA